MTLDGTLIPDRLTATIGAYNGTPGLQAAPNDPLLYVGRVTANVPVANGQFTIGSNAGYSNDEELPFQQFGEIPASPEPGFSSGQMLGWRSTDGFLRAKWIPPGWIQMGLKMGRTPSASTPRRGQL